MVGLRVYRSERYPIKRNINKNTNNIIVLNQTGNGFVFGLIRSKLDSNSKRGMYADFISEDCLQY